MNTIDLITLAEKDGLRLNLSSNGKIKVIGNESSLNKWQPTIQEHKPKIIEILKLANDFERLYAHLAPKYEWGDADYHAWKSDFKRESTLTIQTLNALKNAYQEGRYQNICSKDWERLELIGCEK